MMPTPLSATPAPIVTQETALMSALSGVDLSRPSWSGRSIAHAVDQTHLLRVLRQRLDAASGTHRILATVWGPSGLQDVAWQWGTNNVARQSGQLICAVSAANDAKEVETRRLLIRVSTQPSIDPDVNLLNTVPTSWLPSAEESQGTDVIERFAVIWSELSRPLRAWFNALFWRDPWRLYAFLTAPGSLKHHHARRHGLFEHSVDCAWRALSACQEDRRVRREVLAVAALLHDVGKAGEYDWQVQRSRWTLSDRGALVGHRLTSLEWMAAARTVLCGLDTVDERTAISVYHAIHACHAADWVGLRSPRTPEAFYLASVDSLSGHCDLIGSLTQDGQVKGRYHPAFRGSVFLSSSGQA